jgi:CRISPR-associated endonuclease Cas2
MKKITKIKTKYYSKEILKYLISAGAVYVAASSPYFAFNLTKNISKLKPSKNKSINSFSYLKRRGLIEIQKEGYNIQIALTKEGKRLAGKYQINDLEIERSRKWDKKWRVVIFDVPSGSRMIRDIFRRKLKGFGFYRLQQSVWICPYPCQAEIKLLREFLGLNKKQLQVLEVNKLEDDSFLRKIFKIS